ncbi:glycosyltransferase family 10 domain-containing protein [Methylococcus sp. EFPC2]|uniref:glycosyltransferase family 10 domain-containing protein n=1 Tax=Methylococcus sp. EFPC2 TaxID=2812648 RepID=UPI0019670F77|nr:glycosyltransferase family 10 [Methylococcus sp. EFPC2]QSA96821.1 hypothetical protein JWZ97_16685 [Methylococcus sp. EFPC2]
MNLIKVGYSDISPFVERQLHGFLVSHFPVVKSDSCDYLICSVGQYGGTYNKFLKIDSPIRIFWTGENVIPDFNLFDYAFGFSPIVFSDRYFRCPNYVFYDSFKFLLEKRPTQELAIENKRFCNFIYSNSNCHPYRDNFFRRLSEYKRVDLAGGHLNNIGFRPEAAYSPRWEAGKLALQRQYKFSIAMENSSTLGYTTEKIVQALASGTIPIYWGNPEIANEFSPECFINCHDFITIDDVIDRVVEIDTNDQLYHSIVRKPFFDEQSIGPSLYSRLVSQFDYIFRQPIHSATRRNKYVWGAEYEMRAIMAHECLAGEGAC